ncbi:1951_t:CDS:2, partial [Funneliformis geosporum]
SSEKELYDPHGQRVPSPAHPEMTGIPPREGGQTKIQIIQQQVDSTKGEIQKTIQEIAGRGKKLEELEEQTAMLSDSATKFKAQSTKVRKTMWWKNTKMTIIITVTILLILAAIIRQDLAEFPNGKGIDKSQ